MEITDNIFGWAGEGLCIDDELCQITIDLDLDDSGGLTSWHYPDSIYCPDASVSLSDIDADVYSDKEWDSVHVDILIPVAGNAVLTATPVAGVAITGAGTRSLLIENTGAVTQDDLATQITQLALVPDGALLDMTYIVSVVGYAADLISDTAFAYLYIGDRTVVAGADVILQLCRGPKLYDLLQDLPPDASMPGYWDGGLPQDGMVDLQAFDSGSYYYIVEDPNCGPDTAAWDITVVERPDFDIGGDTMLCASDELVLTMPQGYAGYWQDSSNTDQQVVTSSGWHWLEIAAGGGCTFRDSLFVEFVEDIMLDTLLYLCADDSISFLGATYSSPGVYDMLRGGQGTVCDTQWIIEVRQELSDVGVIVSGTFCNPGVVQLATPYIPGVSYAWSTGDTTRDIVVATDGIYFVTMTYGDRCLLVDSARVDACDVPVYYIPNIFSPNGDGINDALQVFGSDVVEVLLHIYDRWGGLLHEDTGPMPAWDGRTNGALVPPGVYVLYVELLLSDGSEVRKCSSVTVVR